MRWPLLTSCGRLVVATLLAGAMIAQVPGASPAGAATAPGAMPAFGPAIEDYAPYEGQTICWPAPTKGAVLLQKWLIARYDGTGTSGISRGCDIGGRSEHKEGRAFDWRVDVANPTQRAQAETFIALLRATDGHGNRNAVARRMGLMYFIWNDRIYSAGSGFTPRPYVHPACRSMPLDACSVTLRHRDHIHISMSWAGALGRTSFWDGTVSSTTVPAPTPAPRPVPIFQPVIQPVIQQPPKPALRPALRPPPKPALRPALRPPPTPAPAWPPLLDQARTPVALLSVPASGAGVTSSFSLAAGRTYRLVASGVYGYGPGSRLADAACSWHLRGDEGWSGRAEGSSSATTLKLTVNGQSGWRARDGRDCDGDEHVYVWDYTPTTSGALRALIDDPSRGDDDGALELRVLAAGASPGRYPISLPDLAPEPASPPAVTRGDPLTGTEVLTVDAARGGRTEAVLQAGREYIVEASGVWSAGEGVVADAECSRTPGGAWQQRRSSDPLRPWLDSFDLYADGVDLAPLTSRCEAGHVYRYRLVPNRTSQMSFATWDATPGDDVGSLQVTVWPRPRW